jgi:hypothetical protein
LVRLARDADHCALTYPATHGRGRWFHSLVAALQEERPAATFLHVPQDPDRIERVILELVSLVNPAAQAAVASSLRAESDTIDGTLELLEKFAGGCIFIVDGWSALQSTEELYEAGYALAPRIDAFRNWLARRA